MDNVFKFDENINGGSNHRIFNIGNLNNQILTEKNNLIVHELKNSYRMVYGYPIHIKSLDKNLIWERIKETKVWEIGSPDAE